MEKNKEREGEEKREEQSCEATFLVSTFLSLIHISVDPPRTNFLFLASSSKIVSLKYSPRGERPNPSSFWPHPRVLFSPRHDRSVLQGSALRAWTSVPGSRGTTDLRRL